jgi:hypothetical protein
VHEVLPFTALAAQSLLHVSMENVNTLGKVFYAIYDSWDLFEQLTVLCRSTDKIVEKACEP